MPIETPRLVNIVDLKSTPRKPTLIHFTAEQWKQATRGAKQSSSVKKGHPYVEYTPLPDDTGIVHADCGSPSPDEICSVRPVIDRPVPPPGPEPGPGPGPDPFLREQYPVRWECMCRPRRNNTPPVVVRPACELVVERAPRLRIRCNRISCTRQCNLRLAQVNGRWRIFCECA
jgi:hypothetical protein